jgi:deazaflavin-dependent oxidoreductase (nitroreductase family)
MQIILTTTGARSGESRSATLYAWEHGHSMVIVGSVGGAPHHPAWVHNLRADPRATVKVAKERFGVTAREVMDADERTRLWRLVVDRFKLYETYQRKTDRLIPLLVLDRTVGP